MQFYTVHFTTKEIVTRYDKRGKPIEEINIDHPQTVACLPHTTAMQYRDQDNFRLELYELDQPRSAKQERRLPAPHVRSSASSKQIPRSPRPSAVQSAAASGDLAAAIGGGR